MFTSTNFALLTIAKDNVTDEMTLCYDKSKKGVERVFDIPKGSAIADVDTFRKGMANAYNHYQVMVWYSGYVAPFENKDLTPEERDEYKRCKDIYDRFKKQVTYDKFYGFLARVWFGFNMRNVDLSAKATEVVNVLTKAEKNYTFSKNDCKAVNDYLNELMKPYVSEYDEVKNFTAKLKPADLKRLNLVVTAEKFKGTKTNGVTVVKMKRVEMWRQFMLYSLAECFGIWEVAKAKEAKVVELIG